MLFNSYAFVFAYLPIFVIGYYCVLQAARKKLGRVKNPAELYLVVSSLIFFGAFGLRYFLVFALSIIWNLFFVRALQTGEEKSAELSLERRTLTQSVAGLKNNSKKQKRLLAAGVIGNLILLLYFKYAGFFAGIWNVLTGSGITVETLLPLAISFYTFGQISMLVDIYRGDVKEVTVLDYLAYITFFPKILQGPIARYEDMKKEFDKAEQLHFNSDAFMQALALFVLGLSKKAILADTIGTAVDYGFTNAAVLTPLEVILTATGYLLQIYFDFSGYCDMAQGVCRMIGMELPVNFNSPYQARNIGEFWKRWHMTMTGFFTRYVYIPLGGNRRGAFRTYLNIMIVFALSGFWHGAGWHYIAWGSLHGIMSVMERLFQKHGPKGWKHLFPRPVGVLLTFLYCAFAQVFFRAATVPDALTMLGRLFQAPTLHISPDFIECFQIDELWYIFKVTPLAHWTYGPAVCMWLILGVSFFLVFFARNAYEYAKEKKVTNGSAFVLAVLFVWSVLKFAAVSTYIYLGF